MAELVPGSFTVDHLGIYPGLSMADEPEHTCCPYFTFGVALDIISDWIKFESLPDEPPAKAFYDAERDTFRMFEPATNAWHELEGERFGPNTLYAMGRDLWTWQRTHDND